jgi:hypothetical protein
LRIFVGGRLIFHGVGFCRWRMGVRGRRRRETRVQGRREAQVRGQRETQVQE